MRKVIAILNQKGGVGKTTLATHIASCLHRENEKVLLVDSDTQGSARDWSAANENHEIPVIGLDRPTLEKDINAVSDKYSWVIIDGAPRANKLAVSAIKASDLILIPVQPSPYDVWATSDLVDLIKQRQEITDGKPAAAFVVSRKIQGTTLAKDVLEAVEGYGFPILKTGTSQRVVFAQTAINGLSAFDADPKGVAANEITNIVQQIKELLDGNDSRKTQQKNETATHCSA